MNAYEVRQAIAEAQSKRVEFVMKDGSTVVVKDPNSVVWNDIDKSFRLFNQETRKYGPLLAVDQVDKVQVGTMTSWHPSLI